MNIVLLARYFPPVPAGGARRPYLMARALKDMGHRVFVASPSLPSEFEGLRLEHISPEPPKDVNPLGTPVTHWSLRHWGRELLRWPDPDSAWVHRLSQEIKLKLPFTPDWIITSAPPESLLLAGSALKKHYGCQWLADFRDCWLDPPRRPERRLWFRRYFEAKMARHLLKTADEIIAVDQKVSEEISHLCQRPVQIVPQLIPPPIEGKLLQPFEDIHLVYTGQIAIGDSERHIQHILTPFEQARLRNPRLRLHICGHLTQAEISALKSTESQAHITYYGALSLDDTRLLQASADGLIVLSSPKGWAIPGKLFEYWATSAPIIAIGSGPWRKSAGLDLDNDPVVDMAALKKRSSLKAMATHEINDVGRERLINILKA